MKLFNAANHTAVVLHIPAMIMAHRAHNNTLLFLLCITFTIAVAIMAETRLNQLRSTDRRK